MSTSIVRSELGGALSDLGRQVGRIDGVERRDDRRDEARLVGLQVSDHVPLDTRADCQRRRLSRRALARNSRRTPATRGDTLPSPRLPSVASIPPRAGYCSAERPVFSAARRIRCRTAAILSARSLTANPRERCPPRSGRRSVVVVREAFGVRWTTGTRSGPMGESTSDPRTKRSSFASLSSCEVVAKARAAHAPRIRTPGSEGTARCIEGQLAARGFEVRDKGRSRIDLHAACCAAARSLASAGERNQGHQEESPSDLSEEGSSGRSHG